MASRGHPPKLTAAIQQALVNAVSAGVSLSCAAELAGVHPATVKEWFQRGMGTHPTRRNAPLYASFANAITQARAADETRRVARINQAGQGGALIYRKTMTYRDGSTAVEERHAPPDWQADAWHLERSRAEDWGRPQVQKVALTTPDGEAPYALSPSAHPSADFFSALIELFLQLGPTHQSAASSALPLTTNGHSIIHHEGGSV